MKTQKEIQKRIEQLHTKLESTKEFHLQTPIYNEIELLKWVLEPNKADILNNKENFIE